MRKTVKKLWLAICACLMTVSVVGAIATVSSVEANAEGSYTLTFEMSSTREDWAESSKLSKDYLLDSIQTIGYQNTDVYVGSEALVVTETEGTTSGQAIINTHARGPIADWDANKTYTVSFMLKGAPIHLYFDHGEKVLLDDWVRPGDDWTYYEHTFTPSEAKAGSAVVRYSFVIKVAEANKQAYIDDFFIEECGAPTTATVTTGSAIGTLPSLDVGKAWAIDGQIITADTVWNYSENKTATIVDTYTLTFEEASQTEDWIESSKIKTGYIYQASSQSIGYQSEEVYAGSEAVKIVTTGKQQGVINPMGAGLIAYKAGQEYKVSFKMKGLTAFNLLLDHGSPQTLASGINPGDGTAWNDYSLVFTPGASQTRISFLFQLVEAGTLYIDNLFVEYYQAPQTATVANGCKIGAIPEAPSGYMWTLDGEILTADTVYTYTESKTASLSASYLLNFQYPDMVDTMGSGDYGVVFNGTPSLANGVLTFTTGTADVADTASPWVRLSSTTLPAGDYVLKFKMLNTKYVNLMYEVGAAYGSNRISIQGNVSDKAEWTEYEYTITLSESVSSLYFLIQAHAGAGEISIDELNFTAVADGSKSVVQNCAIGTLPTLAEGYYWTIDGDKVAAEYIYNYGENKVAIASKDVYYTLSFEGAESKTVLFGNAIGQLPSVPEKEGYTNGRWTIDGEAITAETVYDYAGDKTAVAKYDAISYTLTFKSSDTREDWAESSKLSKDYLLDSIQTIGYQNTDVYVGSEALVVTETAGTTSGQVTINTHARGPITSWDANKTYTVSFMLKGAPIHLYFDHGEKVLLDDWIRPGADWTYYEYTFTPSEVKAGSSVVRYSFVIKVAEANKQAYIDDFYIEECLGTSQVTLGSAIGTLPNVPEKEGYDGYWAIGGEKITEATVWSYTEDKLALPYYEKSISTFTVTVDGVVQEIQEGEYAVQPETPQDYEDEDFTYTFDNWYIVDTDTVFDFNTAITQDYNVESRFNIAAKAKTIEITWSSGNFEPNVDGTEYTRIRLNTVSQAWTVNVNGTTAEEYLALTRINGIAVKEINESAKANGCEELIMAYIRNGGSFSFYALYIPNSFTEILAEDVYTVTVDAGWQYVDGTTNNTYINSNSVTWYFRDKTFQQNTGAYKDINATADFTFACQGDQGNGATCFILNTKDVSGLWTGTNGTMGKGNPVLNMIYINGRSIKDWNADAQAALDAGDITDICYGSTNAQNTNAGAPIAVRPGYANSASNGAFFQIWIANDFLSAEEIYSFEWKAGFSFMFTNTNDLYYMSEGVKFEKVNGAWVNSNDIFTLTVHDYDGTVLDTQRVVYGQKATAVANPSRPMTSTVVYTFIGWEDEDGNPFDFASSVITSDLTIIAQYTEQAIAIETTEIQEVKFLFTDSTDNWLVFKISNHDYTCSVGQTTYVVSMDDLSRIGFLQNVIIQGTLVVGEETVTKATLEQILTANGAGTLINYWGEGTFGVRVRGTVEYNSITAITVNAGTHFPSYNYSVLGDRSTDVRYMTVSEIVFKPGTSTQGSNGSWTTPFGSASTSGYDITMAKGAGIRIVNLVNYDGSEDYMTTEGYKQSGIRFQTNISVATIQQIQGLLGNTYESVSFGTLIVPSADLVGGQFNHEWLIANGVTYLDVPSSAWVTAEDYAFAKEEDGYVSFYGSIVNLKPQNHSRYFSGIGYIKIKTGEETIYFYAPYDSAYSRSATYIAQAAVADRSAEQTDKYNNKIDENNNWSPYTEGEIAFLKLYMSTLVNTEVASQSFELTSTGALATVANSRNTGTLEVNKKLNGAYVQLNYQTDIDVWGKFYYQNSAGTKKAEEDFYLQKGSSQHKQFLDIFRKNGVGTLAGLTQDDLYLTKITFQNATVDRQSSGRLKILGLYSTAKNIGTLLTDGSYGLEVYITKALNGGGEMTLGTHLGLGGALTYLAKSGIYEGVTSGTYNKGNVLMRTSTESFVAQRNTDWWGTSKEAGYYGHATSSKPGDGAVNLINNYDVGRQVQQSWYANVGGSLNGNTGANGYTRLNCTTGDGGYWPYNPVQAGDCGNNPSQIIDYEVNEAKGYIYVKTRAMDWAYGTQTNGSTTKSYMENYYRLNTDGTIYVNNSFVEWNGFTDMGNCDFCLVELPAFIPVHTLNHFFTYDGKAPWTDDALTMKNDLSIWTSEGNPHYQSKIDGNADGTLGEEWVAWANDHLGSVALGLYIPNVTRFVSGRYETAVTTATSSNVNATSNLLKSKGLMSNMPSVIRTYQSCYVTNTSYTAPGVEFRMEAYKPITYTYVLSVNDINTIRSQFKAIHDAGRVTNAGSKQGDKVGLDAWARGDKIWTQF